MCRLRNALMTIAAMNKPPYISVPGIASQALARTYVMDFLGPEKAALWWDAPNPLLGNVSPNDMVRLGKQDRLFQWIEQQMITNGGRGP
jgi:hypothetical protein